MIKVFGISSRHSHTSIVQDPTIRYAKKKHMLKFYIVCLKNDKFE